MEQLQGARPDTLRKFFTEHNCRSEKRIQERLDAIDKATPAVQDRAMLEAGPIIVAGVVALLQTLADSIADLDRRIEQVASNHPERFLFADLPGAGPVLTAPPDGRLRN